MVGNSQKAARYGSRAEIKMAEKYGLDLDRTSWRDAIGADGCPVEIKATQRERDSGAKGRFRLFKEQHERLSEQDGSYIFVAYRPYGRGIQVLDNRKIPVDDVAVDWGPSNHMSPNREAQKKLAIDEVFR